jgi:hypothetical protein
MTELVESAEYEGLMDLIDDEPPPPNDDKRIKGAKEYPVTVKVHINDHADCNKFADLLGCDLSSDKTEITFNKNAKRKAGATYTEKLADPLKRSTNHKTRDESILWGTTTDFRNDPIPPYQTFEIILTDVTQHIAFLRLLKQQLSFETTYTYFPKVEKTVSKGKFWVSRFEDHQPRYPIFIVSKGRAYSRVTAMALQRMGVPFRIIIEPQDWDDYEAFFDASQLIVAPFSNHGDGPGRARNLAWDIAIKEGHTAHWVMDDNIKDFYRLHENSRTRFADGGCFRVMEDFFDRCENLYIAGPQYRFFCAPRSGYSPFVLNTRIYSCLLIRNDCKYRWRGRYNEDTDLSLRVLKDGDCTLQWNEFLQEKMATQALSGGNTAEFYHTEHITGDNDPELGKYHANGTWNKSIMLEKMHPDVAKAVWKFGRWHHEVDYNPFKANKLRFKAGMETSGQTYPFELVTV